MKRARLSELRPGMWAVIAQIAEGVPDLTRLRELGLLPGARIQFVRRAPLGDPVEISVRGALLSLRDREAAFIEVDCLP